MNYSTIFNISYIFITILLVVYVANYLFRNGKTFLNSAFKGAEEVANSINNLLKMGFYLVNIGYALISIKININILDVSGLLEILAIKIGLIVLILGAMHFFNMYILYLIGKMIRERKISQKRIESTYI